MNNLKNLLLNNPIAKIAEILLLFILAYLGVLLTISLASDNPIYYQTGIWVLNLFMIFYVWAGMKIRGHNCSYFGLLFRKEAFQPIGRLIVKSLIVFALAVLAFALGSVIMANITGIPEQADFSEYEFMQNNILLLIPILLGVLIASSFGEELIYRGFLINRFKELLGNTKRAESIAVLISAVIFGLVHFSWGPMGIVQTTFMGLVLGIAYLRLGKNLWILVLTHAYMDIILMVQMYLGMQ